MPFNGSNVYSPPGTDFPAVTNTLISSTHFNNVINDIATALSDCVTRDGQGALTANLNMGGFKVTNLAAGSVGAPGLYMSSDTSTGLYRSAANEIAFSISGTQRGRFDSTGLIVTGVGTFSGAVSGTVLTGSTSVITPIVDSGSTAALALKTNNGQLGFEIINSGTSGVNWQTLPSSSTPILQVSGSDKTGVIASSGTGSIFLATGAGARNVLQIVDTAASTRFIKISASTTNPTIDVSAGSLAITPAVVMASTLTILGASISIGTNPAASGTVRVPFGSSLVSRNQANSTDYALIEAQTRNSVNDVIQVGVSTSTAGVILRARSGGAAPTTSDLSASEFTVWRDTGGGTTKLYYNNAGAIQSVALA